MYENLFVHAPFLEREDGFLYNSIHIIRLYILKNKKENKPLSKINHHIQIFLLRIYFI